MIYTVINSLNAELNPICHLLALVWAYHILHVSREGLNTDYVHISKYIFQ